MRTIAQSPPTAPDGSSARLRILFVPGHGGGRPGVEWQQRWEEAINQELACWGRDGGCEVIQAEHGTQFQTIQEPSPVGIAAVLDQLRFKRSNVSGTKLAGGGTWRELPEKTRWFAGLLALWAEDTQSRAARRRSLLAIFRKYRPDLICGAGTGSLTLYDTFARNTQRPLLKDCSVITLGSPLGNTHVRAIFGGKITALTSKHWFNLLNPCDDSLSAPLQEVLQEPVQRRKGEIVSSPGEFHFREVLTPFNEHGMYDDDPIEYLRHKNTRYGVWRVIAGASPMPYDSGLQNGWDHSSSKVRNATRPDKASPLKSSSAINNPAVRSFSAKPDCKALIVGICNYPTAAHRLSGCINDAYLVSELLQECGYASTNIRLLLDDRATAAAMRERLEWLLRDAPPGSRRVFYYAGHGAQIGSYGIGEQVDTLDECLVPYDFDWSTAKAISDDWFYDLYSQLSYSTQFTAILDCCHAGGMTRDGAQVRGLNPPGDIRHRLLKWNSSGSKTNEIRDGKWESRFHANHIQKGRKRDEDRVRRLGQASPLRAESGKAKPKEFGHVGPYKPVIIKACAENEPAQEFHDGSIAYGAFTYAMHRVVQRMREEVHLQKRKALPSPSELITLTRKEFHALGITGQHAEVDGPSKWRLKEPFIVPPQ